jgi:hypothetical protein
MKQDNNPFTNQLRRLRSALEECGEQTFANRIKDVIEMPRDKREEFLVSNDLWGGSGSIADQAGVDRDRSLRRKVESALIELGDAQVRNGLVNQRTMSWVDVFRKWAHDGI